VRKSILILLSLFPFPLFATHIVGGDFSLKHLGSFSYELTLKVFRDCENGEPPFNKPLYVGIYDKETNSLIESVRMDLRGNDTLRFAAGNCMDIPTGCTHIGLYRETITLDPAKYSNPNGYYFSWERCCRNSIIKNISNPDESGMAFYMEIPPVTTVNNSPVFNRNPLTLLCVSNPYRFNFDVTDADGDSLVYSLVSPLRGTLGSGFPNDPSDPNYPYLYPGPYPPITWRTGYGINYIINGSPTLTIDAANGEIGLTPTQTGVYVVAVLCEEFRNGVKIGEVRRELQFTITTCGNNTNPVFSEQVRDKTFHVTAGEKICFDIEATDSNDSLYMEISSDIFDPLKTPAPVAELDAGKAIGKIKVDAKFCWQTTCAHQGIPEQIIDLFVKDNGCPIPKVAISTVTVIVDDMPFVPPTDMLCMGLYNNQELDLFWGDSSSAKYFKYYLLFRGIDGSNFTVIDTIYDKSKRMFHDANATNYQGINYMYFMVGVNLCDVQGNSSDTISTFEQLKAEPDPVSIRTATVDNQQVQLKWSFAPEKDFSYYHIMRKKNLEGEEFKHYTNVGGVNDTLFTDVETEVNKFSYCYMIVVRDTCGNQSITSNIGCSILLKGVSEPFLNALSWTQYLHWDGGVKNYELERKDPEIPYFKIGTHAPVVLNTTDGNLNYNEGAYWYKVRAYEADAGFGAESVSNEVYLVQAPKLYVPNAFTPNGDGFNEVWGHVPVFVKDLKLNVYNRWGQHIFESDDKLKQWDGTYKDLPVQEGAYVWLVTYTGYDSSTHYDYGTVTVLR
jgi:gliding motility-associated-like protein